MIVGRKTPTKNLPVMKLSSSTSATASSLAGFSAATSLTPHTSSTVNLQKTSSAAKQGVRKSIQRHESRERMHSSYPRHRHNYPKDRLGYPRGSYPTDRKGYKVSGGYSSTELKRRRFELEQQRHEEQQKTQGYSPECYLASLGICLFVMIALIVATIEAYKLPFPDDRVVAHEVYAHETYRKALVIMSDNLDCSLYMKRQMMQRVDLREVVLAGLQCLFINEPHSVAPDSGMSLLFYYRQERESAAQSMEHGVVNKKCFVTNASNINCSLRSYLALRSSKVELSDIDFMHKGFNTPWMLKNDFYNKSYVKAFRKLARFEDSGEDNPFKQAYLAANYNQTALSAEDSQPTRVFRIANLFITLRDSKKKMDNLKKFMISSNYTAIFQINETTKRKDKINITKELTRYVVNHYLYQTVEKGAFEVEMLAPRLRLRGDKGNLALIPHLLYPNGPTHSIFSAFTVATVFNYHRLHYSHQNPSEYTSAMLLAHVMKAQRLAYHFFVDSKEWSGKNEDVSMFSRISTAVKYLEGRIPMGLKRPIRKKVDRSASIVVWNRGFKEEVHVVGVSLPSLFDSKHIHDGNRSAYGRFFYKEGKGKSYISRSQPFMSHAGLIFTEQLNLDSDTNHPQLVASCSGSVRNAEAVATSMLSQLLLKSSPGKAVWNASVFYDVRNGKMFCDHEGPADDSRFKNKYSEIEKLYGEAMKLAGMRCTKVSSADVEAMDRILMVGSRVFVEKDGKKRESIINPTPYMTGAIDPRAKDYNYAAGY